MAAVMNRVSTGLKKLVPKMPERLKGGRLEKWADYWVGVGTDYKESFITIGQDMRARPLKSAIYLSAFATAYYLSATNPTEHELRSRLSEHMNDVALMAPSIKNKVVDAKLNHMVDCYNNNTLRRLNLILFSLAWQDNYSSECAVYKATVSHLKPRYFTFLQERVLDVGFFGRWWQLERLMETVDINDDEWDEQGMQRPQFVAAAAQQRRLGMA